MSQSDKPIIINGRGDRPEEGYYGHDSRCRHCEGRSRYQALEGTSLKGVEWDCPLCGGRIYVMNGQKVEPQP